MPASNLYKSPFFVSFLGTLLLLSLVFIFLYGSAALQSVPREDLPTNPNVPIQDWMDLVPLNQDVRSVAYINSEILSMHVNQSLPIFTLYFSSTDIYLNNLSYIVKIGLDTPSTYEEVGVYVLGLKDEFVSTANSSLVAKGVVPVKRYPFTIYKLVVNVSGTLEDGYAALEGNRLFLSIGDETSMAAIDELLHFLSYRENLFEDRTVRRILYAIADDKEDYIGLSFLMFPGQVSGSLMTSKAVFLDDGTVLTLSLIHI